MEIENTHRITNNNDEEFTKLKENQTITEDVKRKETKKASLKDLKSLIPERSFRDKRRNTVCLFIRLIIIIIIIIK